MIILVTNPKCHITQQFRIDNCRQVKGFLYFYSKPKRERQEQWQNCFTFSHVISEKKLETSDLETSDLENSDLETSDPFEK